MTAAPSDATHFPSRRDLWLAAVIWVGAGGAVFAGVAQLESGASLGLRAAVLLLCFGGAAFMLWVLYGTHYTLTPDRLLIRSGPLRFRVPLAEIASVTPSRNPLSSPACSLDRLHVRYRESRRGVLISPLDKTGFLQALVARCPQLELAGDRAVSRQP